MKQIALQKWTILCMKSFNSLFKRGKNVKRDYSQNIKLLNYNLSGVWSFQIKIMNLSIIAKRKNDYMLLYIEYDHIKFYKII